MMISIGDLMRELLDYFEDPEARPQEENPRRVDGRMIPTAALLSKVLEGHQRVNLVFATRSGEIFSCECGSRFRSLAKHQAEAITDALTLTAALPCHSGYLKVLPPVLGEGQPKQGPQNGKASAFPNEGTK